jgi:hypothetical protein
VGSPGNQYQRGNPAFNVIPSNIFQLYCGQGAFLFDSTKEPPLANPNEAGPAMTFGVTWAIPNNVAMNDPLVMQYQPTRVKPYSPAIRPWGTTVGNPDLVIQVDVRIPTANISGPGAVTQFNINFYVLDTTTGRFFQYILQIYNNRSFASGEAVLFDGGWMYIASQLPADGTSAAHNYYAVSPYSRGSSITPWGEYRRFRVHIGRDHIARAIQDINASRTPTLTSLTAPTRRTIC